MPLPFALDHINLWLLRDEIEATVHLSGKDIHVACHDADMYAAIDGLVVVRAAGLLDASLTTTAPLKLVTL